jgi:hypothetical protein
VNGAFDTNGMIGWKPAVWKKKRRWLTLVGKRKPAPHALDN